MTTQKAFSQTFVNGAELLHSHLNTLQTEAQAEFEARADYLCHDGFVGVNAFVPAIDGSSVTFSTGHAYFNGVHYQGPGSIDLSMAVAGSYYIYIDHATATLLAATEKPSVAAGLLICLVACDGAGVLSDLVDLRVDTRKHREPVVTVTADYTVTGFQEIVLADATTAGVTVFLPPAGAMEKICFEVKKVDPSANLVTIAPYGAETIDGEASIEIDEQYSSLRLVSDGANWFII